MTMTRVRARDVRKGDGIWIQASGCDPQQVGEALGDATPARGGRVTFRVQYSPVYSGARVHFPNTLVLVSRGDA